MTEREMETDVLIVGGGGAGFRAAIGAKEEGVRVLLLSKGPLARCGATPMAGADFTLNGRVLREMGYNGAPNDSDEKVFNDILTQGFYLNNQKLVEHYIRMAPYRLKELIDWGISISFSEERAVFTTGISIMDVLLKKARSLGVEMLEDTMLIDLLIQEGKVAGALGLDIRSGEFINFKAKAIVIATGGWHKAFWPNTGMRDLAGDGVAMTLRSGADLGNMEFITFCSPVIYEPPIWRGSLAVYLLSLLAGGKFTNNKGEDFLEKYDPYTVQLGTTTEWNKSFLSFAMAKEVKEGRGVSGGAVHYSKGDVSWERFESAASLMFPNWKYKAMDLKELGEMLRNDIPVKVGPAVEYFDGGIMVNEHFATTLEGLYAAGECAYGTFGANRVFSAITEMLVHGADAGEKAANYAKKARIPQLNHRMINEKQEEAVQPLMRKKGLKPAELRRQIQQRAHEELGPIRNEKELSTFIDFLRGIKKDGLQMLSTTSKSRIYNKEWIDALELKNIVQVLEAAAVSALFRTESRGVHYRDDYPQVDNDNWLQETIIRKVDGDIRVSKHSIITTTLVPPKGVTPYLEMIKKMMEAHSEIGGHH